MTRNGICGYSVYLPRLRLERSAIAQAHAWALPALKGQARGQRSLANWDEDSVTMAVAAVRSCLGSADRPAPDALVFASTTAVFDDFQNASLVAAASGLGESLRVQDVGGSLRAASSALIAALETPGRTLIAAADDRQAKPGSVNELQYGAGAAAVEVGDQGVIAQCLATASSSQLFVDHFRPADADADYQWEERWVREEGFGKLCPPLIQKVLKEAACEAGGIQHFCLPSPLRGVAASVAKRSGIPAEAVVDNLATQCGDTGVPQLLLMLAAALEKAQPGDKILLMSFGAGCDALLLEVTEAITAYRSGGRLEQALAAGVSDTHYTKLLSFQGRLDMDWGMRAETDNKVMQSQLYRARDQIAGFVGGQCKACGQAQFPVLASCVNCASREGFNELCLRDEPARVATYTADWLQFSPAPPLRFGLVQFDNGARLLMEMVDVDPEQFDVGTPLKMVFRIKQQDKRRGFHRYFWKAAPASLNAE